MQDEISSWPYLDVADQNSSSVAIDESAETTNWAIGKRLRQVRALFVGRRKSNYPQSPDSQRVIRSTTIGSVYWRFDDEPQSRLRSSAAFRNAEPKHGFGNALGAQSEMALGEGQRSAPSQHQIEACPIDRILKLQIKFDEKRGDRKKAKSKVACLARIATKVCAWLSRRRAGCRLWRSCGDQSAIAFRVVPDLYRAALVLLWVRRAQSGRVRKNRKNRRRLAVARPGDQTTPLVSARSIAPIARSRFSRRRFATDEV